LAAPAAETGLQTVINVVIIFYIVVFLCAVPKHPWFGTEIAGLTLAKDLGILCILYSCFAIARRRKLPGFFDHLSGRLYVILFIWAFISSFSFVGVVALTRWVFQAYISTLFIFFVVMVCVDSMRKLEYTALVFVGALDFAALYVLREYQLIGFGDSRVGWVAGDGNYFAAATLLAMPVAFHLMSVARMQAQRWFYLGSVILIFLAFVVTGSRGGFMGLCALFGIMFLRYKKKRRVLLAGVLMVPILLLAPMSPIKRLTDPNYGDTLSADDHLKLWKFGVDTALQHPVLGIGLSNFKRYAARAHVTERGDGYVAHNTYIEFAAELGLLGFLLYMSIVSSTLVVLEKVRRRARVFRHRYLEGLAIGLQEGLVGFGVAAFFVSAQYQKPFWIAVFLTTPLAAIARREFALIRNRRGAPRVNEPIKTADPDSGEDLAVGSAQGLVGSPLRLS
jgi:O-antigen ligase